MKKYSSILGLIAMLALIATGCNLQVGQSNGTQPGPIPQGQQPGLLPQDQQQPGPGIPQQLCPTSQPGQPPQPCGPQAVGPQGPQPMCPPSQPGQPPQPCNPQQLPNPQPPNPQPPAPTMDSGSSGSSGSTGSSGSSGGGCSGAPVIPYFNASSTSITAGQSVTLSWGNITNGNTGPLVQSATIQPGLGEVGSGQSSRTVKPSTTTTYTLTATGCGGTKTQQITVTVGSSSGPLLVVTIPGWQNKLVDLALVNIFVRPGDGHVMATFRNNSASATINATTTLKCANGKGNGALVSSKTVTLNLSPGAIYNQDTGWTKTTASKSTLYCSFTPPSGDVNSGNDSMSSAIP